MKKLFLSLFSILILTSQVFAADEWLKTQPAGTTLINDIDATVQENNEALDRLLSTYKTIKISYSSGSAVTASAGSVVCSNSDGSVRKMRLNTSSTSVDFDDIDTGAEESSKTYYVYANCDADAATATFSVSLSSSAPTGVTSYKRIGSFYNNESGDIEQVSNDNTNISISSGTVSNGGTISIPSGYSEDECDWVIGGNSQVQTDANGESSTYLRVTVNSSRVVTCMTGSGASLATYGSTCSTNYLIACYR